MAHWCPDLMSGLKYPQFAGRGSCDGQYQQALSISAGLVQVRARSIYSAGNIASA